MPSVALVKVQPVAGTQVSVVQALLSLHTSAVAPAWQTEFAQKSPTVHALPSSQVAELPLWVQPLAGSQASLVQTFLSSQSGAAPPLHLPPLQVSLVVQALPSLHGEVL